MIPRRSGRIINIASIVGKANAGTSNAAYAASKGAVISLTRAAAQQPAKHDINVNAICPGVTRTELSDATLLARAEKASVNIEVMEKRRDEAIPEGAAANRRISPQRQLLLASPSARTIPGQSYNMDGGIIP
ncbi:NAD(P)-dependent dehydrogenase (short-subunit alcohol dehydrogenase family) [Constrictibacter sp. MBR-5]|jgi:NAD(P)-dependent dehydrogenase (short-subunit alcohol dehydrogenase family)